MKKRLLSLALTLCMLLSLVVVLPTTAGAAESLTSRDDGVWLYPVDAGYAVSDWAGCTGWGPCVFHGINHYGDSSHNDTFNRTLGHQGLDIGAAYVPVYAARGGVIRNICYFPAGGRGTTIAIEHTIGNGYSYYSIYQHLSAVSVYEGQSVSAGDKIATSGNHMHFAILIAPSNKNINASIDAIEGQGWVRQSGNTQTGRILCNPSSADDPVLNRAAADVKPALLSHMGSVRYTFNKNQVTTGTSVSAPTNVWVKASSSTGNSQTTITLTWGADNASKYWLGIYKNGADASNLVVNKTLTTNSYSSTFSEGIYYVAVAAINSAGEVSAYTDFTISNNTAVSAPTITGITVTGSTVAVSWNQVSNATSYDVYLIQEPGQARIMV